MTQQEKEILNISAELWNKCLVLPVMHADDINDIRFHIHAIQNIVFAREGMRSEELGKTTSIKEYWGKPNVKTEGDGNIDKY